MDDRTERWLIRPRPNPRAKLRLLCFPYAGAGGWMFRTWPDSLPADIELLAVELPGRDTRRGEPAFQRLAPLIAAIADAVIPDLQPPLAIFGHSLGALLGFHFTRELRRRSGTAPLQLFVSGRRAPQLPDRSPMHDLPDRQFVDRLRRLGGIPEVVLQDAELIAHFLPVLRADLAVAETAELADEAPLACPVAALAGASDERATLDEVDAWRVHTSGTFERETFPGGHFFIQSERTAVLGWLARRLSELTATVRDARDARGGAPS